MPDSEIINRLQTLEEENKRLRRAIEELSILNDLSRSIGASLNTEEIIQTVVRRSLRAVQGEQGVVTLVEESEQDSMKTLVRTAEVSMERVKYHFHQSLLGWMYINKKPLVINDPTTDERFRGIQWDASIQSLLVVPLIVKSRIRGVLTVYNKKERQKFSDDDLRLLSIIAAQSAQVVENARLYQQEQDLVRMREQVRLASVIQHELLPKRSPTIQGYEVLGRSLPAQEVGGDLYDFITIDGTHTALCLGDVTGKGVPASLLMANLQATLRGQSSPGTSPKACMDRANTLLHESTSDDKFATVFYCILDHANHQIHYANAGHENPMVISTDGSVRRLATGGIPLGMLPGFSYEDETVPVTPGQTVVIVSDGITEAMNSAQELFGEARLKEVLLKARTRPLTEMIDEMFSAIKAFTGGHPQSDDITLVALRRNG